MDNGFVNKPTGRPLKLNVRLHVNIVSQSADHTAATQYMQAGSGEVAEVQSQCRNGDMALKVVNVVVGI